MRALVLVALVASACSSNASGQITLTGEPTLDVRRCRPGSEFGVEGAFVLTGADEDTGGRLMVRGGARATVVFVPPGGRAASGRELVLDPSVHCSKFEIDDNHVRFDCDAQADRRLIGAVELGACK